MKIYKKILSGLIGLLFAQSLMAGALADSVTETKKINDFSVLKIHGNFNIVLTQGKASALKISAPDKDAMASVEIKASATLTINMKEGSKSAVTLYITVKDVQQIAINTNGTVSCTNTINSDALTLNIDGDATATFMLDVKVLNYTTNSGKPVVLKGKAKTCSVFKDSGEGSVDASELKIDELSTLDDSSDGDLKIYVRKEMHIKIGGSGTLTYYGNPKDKFFKVEGSASESQIVQGSSK